MRRKKLEHDPPLGVRPGSVFFITVCCRPAGINQLCREPAATVLLDSARYRHDQGQWWLRLMLLMPDHLHMLVSFAEEQKLTKVISHWKQYAARHAGIRWQRDFFDHRIRHHESAEAKAEYIRMNPVRAGLVGRPEEWPYVISPAGGF